MTKKISKQDVQDLEATLQEKLYSELLGENATLDQMELIYEIVDSLRGTYHDEGIRRWFHREREQLEGKSPLEYLGPTWDPQEEYAKRVLGLAKTLKGEY